MKPEALRSLQSSIKIAEDRLVEFTKDMRDAKKAGIDVAEREKALTELTNKLSLLKSVYKQ